MMAQTDNLAKLLASESPDIDLTKETMRSLADRLISAGELHFGEKEDIDELHKAMGESYDFHLMWLDILQETLERNMAEETLTPSKKASCDETAYRLYAEKILQSTNGIPELTSDSTFLQKTTRLQLNISDPGLNLSISLRYKKLLVRLRREVILKLQVLGYGSRQH